MEQKLYGQSLLMKTLENCEKSVGMRIETVPEPVNSVSINYEYAKKEIGVFFHHHLALKIMRTFKLNKAHWTYDSWMDLVGIY